MELNSYFQALKKYSESKQQSNNKFDSSGTLFDMTRKSNLGSVIVRPITDANGVPLKIMNDVYEIHETIYDTDENGQIILEDGKPVPHYITTIVADPCNYVSDKFRLSMDQMSQLNSAIESCKKYMEYSNEELIDTTATDTGMWIKFRRELTMFYGKVLSVVTDSGAQDDGNTRFLVHKSSKFYQDFQAAMESNTVVRRDGGAWLSMYFNRDTGSSNKLVSITTALNKPGTIGYSSTISFTDGAPYELTDKDISIAADINNNPYCDITSFDSDKLSTVINRMNKYLANTDAELSAQSGFVASNQPTVGTIDNPPKVDEGFRPANQSVPTNPPIPPQMTAAVPPTFNTGTI